MKKISVIFLIILHILAVDVLAENRASFDFCIPAIMYHQINMADDGSNEYSISAQQIEEDFLQLQKAGFTPITVSEYLQMSKAYKSYISGLDVNQVPEIQILAEKYKNPVLITFDDGYDDGLEIVFPLLQKYGFKANISIVGKYTDKSASFLSWDEIRGLSQSGYVEFGNHSYELHDFEYRQLREIYSYIQNKNFIKQDFEKNKLLLEKSVGKKIEYFTYPYGVFSDVTEEILDEIGVEVSFVTSLSADFVKLSDSTRKISRINRVPSFKSDELVKILINKVKNQSPEAYCVYGKQLTNYIGDSVSLEDKIKITVKNGMQTFNLNGYLYNSHLLISDEELCKIYGTKTKEYGNYKYINIFNELIMVDKNTKTISSKRNFGNIFDFPEGYYPVKEVFENIGFSVQYKNETAIIQKKYNY